jgi:hypothetical protein
MSPRAGLEEEAVPEQAGARNDPCGKVRDAQSHRIPSHAGGTGDRTIRVVL